MNATKMGFWAVLSFVISSQLATGIFLIPHTMAPLGPIAILSWLTSGAGVIFLALVFARFCSWYPETGGIQVYVSKVFGPTWGYFTAWTYWVLAWFGSAPLLATIAGSFCTLFGLPETPLLLFGIQIITLIFLTGLNLRGVEASGTWEIGMTILKMVPLLLFPLYALFFVKSSHFVPFNPTSLDTWTVIQRGSFITLWAFLGIEAGVTPAGSVENASKVLPKALVVGTFIVIALYILNNFVIMGLVPQATLMKTVIPYTAAFNSVLGLFGERAVSLFIMIVCLGAMNVWILAMGQVAKGAADSKFFGKIFARENKDGAPVNALLISAICLGVTLVFLADQALAHQIAFVMDVCIAGTVALYLLTGVAFVVDLFGKQRHTSSRGFFLGIGASSVIFCLWALKGTGLQNLFYALLFPLSGIPFYLYWRWREGPVQRA
jgi:APA family basic amino acid/polyamine antiporter